jgi:uncharacterized protein
MQLDREQGGGNFIRRFVGGAIHVGGRMLDRPFIVSADRIIDDWSPPPIAELAVADLEAAIALEPEVVLLGTGARQVFPSPALLRAMLARGIGLEVMDTAAACRTFNVLASEYRRVVAVLFVR